jgi:digeranylgeranylglycerophospholipid reductase
MTQIEVDVLVIGAGPAGSMAARESSKNGAETLIIDKKAEIGTPKRCAEGIMTGVLERMDIHVDKRCIARDIDGARIVSPDGTSAWFTSETLDTPATGIILERKVFDKHMAAVAAREGAEIRIKTQAKGLERQEDGTFIVTCESMGKTYDIHAKIVIGADGPESHVAKWAGLNAYIKPQHMVAGVQYEMCNAKMKRNDYLEFYFGSVAPGGYFWLFPKGGDVVNAGLGIITNMAEKSAYEYLVDAVDNCYATQEAQAVELNAGGDPVGGLVKEMYGDNIMLVGDAASQVNPLTGGGITNGMLGGRFAGEVAVEALEAGDCSKNFLKKYEKLYLNEMGAEMQKYTKVTEYLWTLDDDDINKIAHKFKEMEFDKLTTTDIVKVVIKADPKSLLKLGRIFL